jgi:glycosyltransferase involved in cell wall biosynthesis
MKILWFTWKDREHPLAGGAEVVNEELAKRLAADGHDVVFMVAGFGQVRTARRDGFRIVRVGSRYHSYVSAVAEYFKSWRAWPELVIDECNTMPYFSAWYTSGRHVNFFHMLCREIWFYEFPQPLSSIGYVAEPLYLRLLPRRAPTITVSESTKKDLERLGYRNVHVIPQGIQLSPVPSLDVDKYDQPTVLSLGSIRPMKRTLDQVQAFEHAKQAMPNLQMKIAGDATGSYGKKVLDYVAKSRYSADIEYTGRVSDEEKADLMRKSHVITVTSVKEGWGLIVSEAASQGTPAAVYDVDGLRDAVKHGKTGLVTRTNHPAALGDSITALLSQPGRYAAMRQSGWELSNILTFDRSYTQFIEALGI